MSISFQSISSLNSTTSTHNRLDVLVEAKNDYTKQLKDILVGPLYQGFLTIYKDAKTKCEKNGTLDLRLRKFQDYVSRIPKWTKDELVTECQRIIKLSKCDWIDYLITAVFVTHAKIRASVKDDNTAYNNVMLNVPKLNLFLHNCYIECARKMWKNAYLFEDINIIDSEYQRNIRDIETLIQDAIDINIRQSLPVKDLLREYLGDNLRVEIPDEIDVTNVSKLSQENMKNCLKKELESITNDLNNSINNLNNRKIDNNQETLQNQKDTISYVIDNSKLEDLETPVVGNISESTGNVIDDESNISKNDHFEKSSKLESIHESKSEDQNSDSFSKNEFEKTQVRNNQEVIDNISIISQQNKTNVPEDEINKFRNDEIQNTEPVVREVDGAPIELVIEDPNILENLATQGDNNFPTNNQEINWTNVKSLDFSGKSGVNMPQNSATYVNQPAIDEHVNEQVNELDAEQDAEYTDNFDENIKIIEFSKQTTKTTTKTPKESQRTESEIMENALKHIPTDVLGQLVQETKDIMNKKEEVDIDMLSTSEEPRIKKNSHSIKQLLDESQQYSTTTSKRKKKYSTFMLRD